MHELNHSAIVVTGIVGEEGPDAPIYGAHQRAIELQLVASEPTLPQLNTIASFTVYSNGGFNNTPMGEIYQARLDEFQQWLVQTTETQPWSLEWVMVTYGRSAELPSHVTLADHYLRHCPWAAQSDTEEVAEIVRKLTARDAMILGVFNLWHKHHPEGASQSVA